MGFFSWNCKCCGHSIRSRYATNPTSAWMSKAVVMTEDATVRGEYDGYGRVGALDLGESGEEPAMYHRACWELSGKPEYDSPSQSAGDQGYFVGEYDPAEPKSLEDLAALKKARDEQRAKDRAEAHAFYVEKIAELEAEGKEVPEYLRRAVVNSEVK